MARPHLIWELSAADVEHVNYSLASWTLPTCEIDLRVSMTFLGSDIFADEPVTTGVNGSFIKIHFKM
eukprot:14061087-Ditylum_brightwellii.AAC.1